MASPAAKEWCTEPDQEVSIKVIQCEIISYYLFLYHQVTLSGAASLPPVTVNEAFRKTVSKSPGHIALKVKRDDVWKTWTYREYSDTVTAVAKSMLHLGLEPHHGVGILGFNSPEWFFSYMGSIMV